MSNFPVAEPTITEPARWPKTVGIISVVWGSLGLLCGTCGIGWMVYLPTFVQSAEKQFNEPFPAVMVPGFAAKVLMVVGMLPPCILVVAGISLLMRKAAARPLHLAYSMLAIVLMAAGTIVQIQQQMAVLKWAKENASSKWAAQAGSPIGLVVAFVMLLIMILWPLFCMVWFGGIKRNPAEWTATPEEPAA